MHTNKRRSVSSGHWRGVSLSCCFCRAPVFSSPRRRDWKWLGTYPSDRTATAENIRRGGGERACSTARDRDESVDWSGSQTISCKSKCSYILICFPLAQKERVRVEIVTHCHWGQICGRPNTVGADKCSSRGRGRSILVGFAQNNLRQPGYKISSN